MPKTYSWKAADKWEGLKDIPKVVLPVEERRLIMSAERALLHIRTLIPKQFVSWVVAGEDRAEAFHICVYRKDQNGSRMEERIVCPFSRNG